MVGTGAVVSAAAGFTQDVFMKLFVSQLKNQNPMEPMDNYQFTSQLAQMGQLEQVTNLASRFEQFLRLQEFGNATSMIGSTVCYVPTGGSESKTGVVSALRVDQDGVKLVVGTDLVPLASVTGVLGPQTASK